MMKSNRLYNYIQLKTGQVPLVQLVFVLCLLHAPSTVGATNPHLSITGPIATPTEANATCIGCHEVQAKDLRNSVHWKWERQGVENDKTGNIKKALNLSRFGIAAAVNPETCRRCHISVQSEDMLLQPSETPTINCLICHDTTGTYRLNNDPSELEHIIRTVGRPSQQNCISCHQRQCGLAPDQVLPTTRDIHLDKYGFSCQRCHPSSGHHDFKRKITNDANRSGGQGCTTCHSLSPHALSRLNQHATLIACQSCHIPAYGTNAPAVVNWNWLLESSTPATYQQDHLLFSAQGFVLGKNISPQYFWDNGSNIVYTRGTKIEPEQTTTLQRPGLRSPSSKIMPFSAQYGTQLYDAKYRYLISPKLVQEKAPLFAGTDWNDVSSQGMKKIRLPYSGQYGFTTTVSFYRLNHGVVAAEKALDCMDCHGTVSRFDWQQLGYEQDPWLSESAHFGTPKPQRELPTIGLPPIRESVLPSIPGT